MHRSLSISSLASFLNEAPIFHFFCFLEMKVGSTTQPMANDLHILEVHVNMSSLSLTKRTRLCVRCP